MPTLIQWFQSRKKEKDQKNKMETATIAPNFKLTALEETQHWEASVVEKLGRIWTVYLYDENRHVYCCEMTPSYELIPVYSWYEKYSEDEKDREEAEETLRENFDYDVVYVHTHSVKPLFEYGNIFEGSGYDYENEQEYQKWVDEFRQDILCNGEPVWFEDGAWKSKGKV